MRKITLVLLLLLVAHRAMAQLPAIVSLTGQTASISAANLYAAAPMQMYRVSYYLATTTSGSAGTVLLTIGWNDGVSAQSLPSATVALTLLTGPASGTVTIWSGAQQNITYSTTVVGAVGGPQYTLRIYLEPL